MVSACADGWVWLWVRGSGGWGCCVDRAREWGSRFGLGGGQTVSQLYRCGEGVDTGYGLSRRGMWFVHHTRFCSKRG